MRYNEETIAALEEAVAIWTERVMGVNYRECPLCVLFNTDEDAECLGCPVADKVGFGGCQHTPYMGSLEARLAVRYDGAPAWTYRRAAALERDFLRDVLDWAKGGETPMIKPDKTKQFWGDRYILGANKAEDRAAELALRALMEIVAKQKGKE